MRTESRQPDGLPAEARLEIRLLAENKRVIERAAAIEGRSMSDFIKTVVVERAKAVIADAENVRLSQRDWAAFVALLDADASVNDKLAAAARDYRQHVAK